MSLRRLDEKTFDQVAIPIVRNVAAMADKFRPEKDERACLVVGLVIAVQHCVNEAKKLPDNERIAHLEAAVMDLATWIYREREDEFRRFGLGAAQVVVSDALSKMRDQKN